MVGLAVALILLLCAASAWAVGSIRFKTTSPDENNGKWKFKCTIDYGSRPHKGHIPMVFSFKHVTQYEWYIDDKRPDKNKPVFRKKTLHNQKPINLDQPVGFSDAMGKTFRKTKYSFKIPRDPDLGFEAGEYMLTVRVRRGPRIGRPIRLTLKGKNKVIDLRSISFVGEEPPKPKPKTDTTARAVEDDGPPLDDDDEDDDDMPPGSVPKPPPEKPKQGGCGCRLADSSDGLPAGGWLALVSLVAFGAFRRRHRAA